MTTQTMTVTVDHLDRAIAAIEQGEGTTSCLLVQAGRDHFGCGVSVGWTSIYTHSGDREWFNGTMDEAGAELVKAFDKVSEAPSISRNYDAIRTMLPRTVVITPYING